MGQLPATEIKTLTEACRYNDRDGLILNIAAGGSKSWILRVQHEGKRRDNGLGSTKVLTLNEARTKAREYRRLIAQGIDPVAEKKKEKVVIPTLLKILRDMETGTTVHGFRSAIRDWEADMTSYPGEVAEAALAHANSNKVEAAYRRTDFLEKRKALMAEWAVYCCGG